MHVSKYVNMCTSVNSRVNDACMSLSTAGNMKYNYPAYPEKFSILSWLVYSFLSVYKRLWTHFTAPFWAQHWMEIIMAVHIYMDSPIILRQQV